MYLRGVLAAHSRYHHPRREVIPLYEAVRQYYKEEQETVRSKWLDIQKRYLATKEMLKLKRLAEEQQQQLDKGADAQVNTKGHKLSSSSSDFGDEKSKQVVRSMLTSSSDTTDDDDEDKSSENAPRQTSIKGKCKRKHTQWVSPSEKLREWIQLCLLLLLFLQTARIIQELWNNKSIRIQELSLHHHISQKSNKTLQFWQRKRARKVVNKMHCCMNQPSWSIKRQTYFTLISSQTWHSEDCKMLTLSPRSHN